MIKVYQQTKTDCVRACVASILELPYDKVPDFDTSLWYRNLNKWLADFGITTVSMVHNNTLLWMVKDMPLLSGVRLKHTSHYWHSVVTVNGEIAHDPWQGDKTDYLGVEEDIIFVVKDPAKYLNNLVMAVTHKNAKYVVYSGSEKMDYGPKTPSCYCESEAQAIHMSQFWPTGYYELCT